MLQGVLSFIAALLCGLLIRTFLFEFAFVKGNSMKPTLLGGEALFVSTLSYKIGEPQRHDIVICRFPGRMMRRFKHIPQHFVKRVIGLPGETIEIVEGVVHINGQPLNEPYLSPAHAKFKTNRGPVTLGADEYYVMGDNRDNSNDSRRIGPINRSMIIGKVKKVLFPLNRIRTP